ncbi:hypothetical protein dqs_0337 [Azoarcus olearius]|uniref:DnaJ family domain-containing protein n=1 Tax=Azoarcus sp. (strain BH72) TaxID=418699 RepID=UPI0008062B7D|nr:DUF1992 domain-containing protein [Azoarcus olearius]ANQ83414.1 hypothetical protein dqs_0337 [Azoarcus olearius]
MSLSVFDILAEQRIADALRRGEFDHLPGAGRPLVFDDEPLLSPEQRMANHILKNAGVTPPEIGLRREIAALRARLETLDGEARARARRELGQLVLRLAELQQR